MTGYQEDSDMDVSMMSVQSIPAHEDPGIPWDETLDCTLTERDFPNITAMEASYKGDPIKKKVRVNIVEIITQFQRFSFCRSRSKKTTIQSVSR